MKLAKLLTIGAFIVGSAAGHAQEGGTGLFLEPGISYQVTEGNIDYPTPGLNSTGTTRGFGALVRGGIHVYERFFVAADARYGLLRFKDNANNIDNGATSWDIAPVIGLQMADYGLRVFAGYVLAGNLDPDGANGFDFKFDEATGWRAGVGLKLQSFSVNVEWQRLTYDKVKIEEAGPLGGTTGNIDFDSDGLVASITFPIEFN